MFFSIVSFAQKNIVGKVINEDGEAVASASVTIEETGKDAIIAYGITNSKGEFKVSFTSSDANLDLKIKAFNHKTFTQKIKNENQTLNFKIQSQTTEIKEVQLKTRIITKKGDTISYDLKSFDTKADRTLADVLKRMPGVEVNKDGSILYQGQPLIKFYVNGKDLMEGGYGVVNNALPKDAVSKVEVMENHQPVKILQNKVPSDQAAINIKLKKQVTMTGRGEVSVGIAEPALWNIKLTPMFFGQKNQWVINYKTNNTGETVEKEANIFAMGSRWEGRRSNVLQNNLLNVEQALTPNLPEKRYLQNNVHFATANILTNPFKNKEWELKAIVNYTNNAVEKESYQETYEKLLAYTSYNSIENNLYTNRAKGEIIFTKNAKEGFFKNVTTFNQFWNADRAVTDYKIPVTNILNRNSAQSLESPSTSFQNSLSTIIPLKNKMLNVMSYLSYQDDFQKLKVTPGNYVFFPQNNLPANLFAELEHVTQEFKLKTLEANHSATMGFTRKFWTFTPEIGLNYTYNDLNSGIQELVNNPDGERFFNDLTFSKTVPYIGLGLNYKSNAWTAFLQMPVNFNMFKAEDSSRFLKKDFIKTTFEPSAFVQYTFASFWKAIITGSWNYNFGSVGNTFAGYMMTQPLSFTGMNPNNPVLVSDFKRAGARIEYRNPLNNLFFNLNYSLSKNTQNLLPDYTIMIGGAMLVDYIERENAQYSYSQSAEIGKYFPKFKSNVSVSVRNSKSISEHFSNQNFYENTNSTQNVSFKLNNSYFSWMVLDYNFTKGWGRNKSVLGETETESYNHNFGVNLYPIENHSVGFYWDQFNSRDEIRNLKNSFFDLSYQFVWTEKKVDFELKWMNIANKKAFEKISDTAERYSYERINIRPRQLMLSVKFNFK